MDRAYEVEKNEGYHLANSSNKRNFWVYFHWYFINFFGMSMKSYKRSKITVFCSVLKLMTTLPKNSNISRGG